jgi:hypothetical protein
MDVPSKFRVVSAFAVVDNHQPRRFVTIPVGSIIETSDDLHQPGFVQIKVDGKTLLAFKRDIEERTHPVEPLVAGNA